MIWASVALREICSPKQHKTIPTSVLLPVGYPVFGANGQIGYYSAYTHAEETVAITCRGATCGTINVAPAKSYITGNAMALDKLDKARVDLRFFVYALRHRGMHDVISGSAQPQITRAPLLDITIPLPPLDEQKRIAAILDQADELRRKRKRAIDRLNQLGQAIFYEMFGDQSSINGWKYECRRLTTVCSKVTDGTHQAPKWSENGIPFIFVSNVRGHRIDLNTKNNVSREDYENLTKHAKIEAGDVLYTCVGSYGHTAVVDGASDFVFQRHIAHIKPNKDAINSQFLAWCLEAPRIKRQADALSTGIAQKTVTLSALKSFEIPLPPMALQLEFGARVAAFEALRAKQDHDLEAIDSLFASIQHRAFQGEL